MPNRQTLHISSASSPGPYPSVPQNLTVHTPVLNELPVSQGGTAMDLDEISRHKGPNGR